MDNQNFNLDFKGTISLTQSNNSSRKMDCSFNISPVVLRKKRNLDFYSESSKGLSELRKNLNIPSQQLSVRKSQALKKAEKVSRILESRKKSKRRSSERKKDDLKSNPISSKSH